MLGQNRMKSFKRSFQFSGESSNSHDQLHQSHSSSSSGASVSELPFCLIPLILVKLPIKIIIICKCVCKSWNRLISDPYFTELYSEKSQFAAMLLIRFSKPVQGSYISEGIKAYMKGDVSFREIENDYEDYDDVIHTPVNLDQLITTTPEITEGSYVMKRLVGSVNGLLCVVVTPYILDGRQRRFDFFAYSSELFFVINPLTGESVKLPQVKGLLNVNVDCCRNHGFGSTVDGDYYKLVRIFETWDENDNEYQWDLKIFTVGVDDEWRDLDDYAILRVFNSDGVALNGALHWFGQDYGEVNSIYAFDVAKEIGCRISCPSSESQRGCLGVWDGNLCFVPENEKELNVWTMRQYGVADSWTKDIILRRSILCLNICPATVPITTRSNGDLLLSILYHNGHKSLISFDPKTKTYVKLDEIFYDEGTHVDLLEYAPCFSSLSGIISKQATIRDS